MGIIALGSPTGSMAASQIKISHGRHRTRISVADPNCVSL